MTRWPSSRSVRCKRVADAGGADVADVHRLGHVRRAEINDHGSRLRGLVKKQMFAARGAGQRLRERGILQPEIQEARAGDFHFFAKFGNVQLGQHVGGELARIQFARLGQRHQRVALVIAKFRIGTGADENGGDIGVRQHGADGGLQGGSICL